MAAPTATTPTTVELFTPEEWAERLLTLYPNTWSGDAAKVAGGILYSFFEAKGGEYSFLEEGLDWLLNACRLATAKDEALDKFAADYFKDYGVYVTALPRQLGEPDEVYRQRISANLLTPGGMRRDIERVVELMTGQKPRIIEPWNVLDTNAADANCFADIDTPENPSRAADMTFPHQGFVESVLPPFGGNGINPIYGADAGASGDRSFVIDPDPTWFMGAKELDKAINRVRMFGTTVWRRYGSKPVVTWARGQSKYLSDGVNDLSVALAPPCSSSLVVLARANWNSSCYVDVTSTGDFKLFFSTSAPGGVPVDYIAAPATLSGFGILPLSPGDTGAELAIQSPGAAVIVTPSWNTTVELAYVDSEVATFVFSNPAEAGAELYYGTFKAPYGGLEHVVEGDIAGVVSFPEGVELPYQVMLIPSWNTEVEISKTENGFTLLYSTEAPAGSYFFWGIQALKI